MNPTAPAPAAPAPQTQPPQPALQPHRPSNSCNRHPEENFTGFCPSCLCERLAVLDPNASNPSSSSSARKSSASALKSIFRPPASSFFPELRRTKSFSASKNEAFPAALFEPQRKSCDVRVRSTLSNLLNHDHSNKTNKEASEADSSKNPASSSKVESKEEDKHEEEEKEEEDEIRAVEESNVSEEIVEEEEGVVIGVDEEGEELKTMKDHIDLDSSSQAKKGRGSFWSAASVFSKKLQKWRQKQKEGKKKQRALPVEKPIGRQFRDTQSEVADYGFGRRSCDTDPRFSLDAGRMSLDVGRMSFDGDPRYSLDEPRASWDGYLIGRTAGFPRMPTMLSVVEDAPVVNVARTDTQIPVEEPPNEDESVPGGSLQTKEYYSDSSSRRRKSLDRSNSVKRRENMDELKSVSNVSTSGASASSIVANNVNNGFSVANSKVTPAGAGAGVGVDYVHGSMRMGGFHDRDDCLSETCDLGASVIGGDRKGEKKSRRWSIWGFIHRRGRNKDDDEDRYSRVNGVERSFSESWQDGRGGGGFGGRVLRSNSSVSWRNAQGIGGGGSFGSFTGRNKNGVAQGNGHGKKGKDEFVLERNRSARYSSNEVDNGLLRFYLTPLRGSRRNGSVKSTSRSNQAHSIARSVLGLY